MTPENFSSRPRLSVKGLSLWLTLILVVKINLLGSELTGQFVAIPEGGLTRPNNVVVTVPGFSLANTETTWGEYQRIRTWALANGYDPGAGHGEQSNDPVTNISWYDAIKFCNAASELAGMTPAYYVDLDYKIPYRSGRIDLAPNRVLWTANGYRLPTEAEWEYAARAGTETEYFWGDDFPIKVGNDYAWPNSADSVGKFASPHPVGQKKPNPHGLYDILGNVSEWCFDWWSLSYSDQNTEHPKGPLTGTWRIARGGSVALDNPLQAGFRHFSRPDYTIYDLGFRVASSGQPPALSKLAARVVPPHAIPDPSPAMHTRHPVFDYVERPEAATVTEALAILRDQTMATLRQSNAPDIPSVDQEALDTIMALQGRIQWYPYDSVTETITPPPIYWPSKGMDSLLGQWMNSGALHYLEQLLYVLNQQALHDRSDFDALGRLRGTPAKFGNQTWNWGMGHNANPVKMLDILTAIAATVGPDQTSQIEPEVWANLLCLLHSRVSIIVKDGRPAIPNQLVHAATELVTVALRAPFYTEAPQWEELARHRLQQGVIEGDYLADGGSLEQSFNYNWGLIAAASKLLKSAPGKPPAWIQELHSMATNRRRLLTLLQQPFGGLPANGSYASVYPDRVLEGHEEASNYRKKLHTQYLTGARGRGDPKEFPDPGLDHIVDHLFGDGTAPAPGFTSIAFPYSGYYAQRTGWRLDSAYLFLHASRRGRGHHCADSNAVDLIAFGRHFLLGAGASNYGQIEWCPEEQRPLIPKIDDYRYGSFSRNTIQVDGQPQSQSSAAKSTYQTTLNNRWLDTGKLGFCEGFFEDGYGKNVPPIPVSHHREVIFVKSVPLWIITDRLQSETAHAYTAVWNFPPKVEAVPGDPTRRRRIAGFREEEVILDEKSGVIATDQPDSPNIALHMFTNGPLTMRKYFGTLDPTYGWLAPGIGGRRYPKTDTHTTWQGKAGSSVLVTLILPRDSDSFADCKVRPLPDAQGIGFEAHIGEKILRYDATPVAAPQRIGTDQVLATAMLTVDENTRKYGLVVTPKAGRAFELDNNNSLINSEPFITPTDFRWQMEDTTLMPVYTKKDARQ
jgi:hypothetical protein